MRISRRASRRLSSGKTAFVERLWEKMFRTDMGMKKQGVVAYALSALDIGCGHRGEGRALRSTSCGAT